MAASQSQDVVVITGSNGFIGTALINRLAGQYRLIGMDRAGRPPPAAEFIAIDLTSNRAVEAAFRRVSKAYGTRVASVIHLAAYFDLSGEPSPLYERITVRGTERLRSRSPASMSESFSAASIPATSTAARPQCTSTMWRKPSPG